MSILNRVKSLFSNAIECPEKYKNEFMYIAPLRRGKIRIGSTLLVREGFIASIIVKEKVTDQFVEGRHKLTVGALPCTSSKIRIEPKRKGQKSKDRFKGEICFINLEKFEQTFQGLEPFIIKDEELGRIKVRVNGQFNFSIDDTKKFITVCLMQWAYLKPQIIKRQISAWVSDEVIKNLKWLKLPLVEIAENNEFIGERISPIINKKFLSYGLDVENIIITETYVPNKVSEIYKEDSDNIDGEVEDSEQVIDEFVEQSNDSEIENDALFEEQQLNINMDKYDDGFGSSSYSDFDFIALGEKVNSVEYEPMGHTEVITELDKSQFDQKIKNCNSCGTRLEVNASACYNCGEKQALKRVCKSCGVEVEEGEFVCPNCRSIVIS